MWMLLGLLKSLQVFNDAAGGLGRSISVIALALMVGVILLQVFCRYVLNNALPWPDEAARFCMLWLTSLMAQIGLRQGGFVAIDTLSTFRPQRGIAILAIILFVISLLVLTVAIKLDWNQANTGWLFASASLKLPLHLIGLKAVKIKSAWIYMSLFTGACLMIVVNIKMTVRQFVVLARQEHHPRAPN